MYISAILDKSTFQSLSRDELYRLSNYYRHTITPVLTLEILGDLKKGSSEGMPPTEVRVKEFAFKLFPTNSVVSMHYKSILLGELKGMIVPFDGRPVVPLEKSVRLQNGQEGSVLKETEEEKSIWEWKSGNFSEADHKLSELWRAKTTQKDLLENLKKSLDPKTAPKFKDFAELNRYVEDVLNDKSLQGALLRFVFQNYGIDFHDSNQILQHWFFSGQPFIRDFAPYTFHCLKVDALFLFGLMSGLIGTRPTNRVDTEYLYYLPFANVFSSNDKVHKNLVPLLLKDYQTFIEGPILKADLQKIVTYLKGLSEEEAKKFKEEPPVIEESETFKLWKRFFNYPIRSNLDRKLSPKEFEMMKAKIDELEKASRGEGITAENEEDPNFIVRYTHMSMQDLCICGSGKKVIDCCIPPEEFIKISQQQHNRK